MPAHPSPSLAIGPDGIGVVAFDDPGRSVNVLSHPALQQLQNLERTLQLAAETGELKGVLFLSRKESSFIVGADIDAISGIDDPNDGSRAARFGPAVFLDIERLPVSTLAAIHGTCMGGGLELALACRYRVASDHSATRLAFPEVLLGILPAWGGTTRPPRQIGLRAALDLILTGRTIDARGTARLGLVDRSLPREGFESAARRVLDEAEAAGELLASEVSGHLVQVFQWREAARRARTVEGGREGPGVDGIGIVGAGIMGGGIAQLAAQHEIPVRLRDVRVESIGRF